MQLRITHKVPNGLTLPINYQHILQSIIYKNLTKACGYSDFLHNRGYLFEEREYRMFTFSSIQGKYRVDMKNKEIKFEEKVSFEVRSPEVFLIRQFAENIQKNGITYFNQHFENIKLSIMDDTVEEEELYIKMRTPICVYSTDSTSGKTYYLTPQEEGFYELIIENFLRKYIAYYGVEPKEGIWIEPVYITEKDKFVTNYKGTYISGWKGEYHLLGQRKYLDFLYQTGLGSKNAQGFGMFDIIS